MLSARCFRVVYRWLRNRISFVSLMHTTTTSAPQNEKVRKRSLFFFLLLLFFFSLSFKLQKWSTTSFLAKEVLNLKQTLFCQVKTRAKKSRMNYALLDGRRACQKRSRHWQRFPFAKHLRISRETLTLIVGIERKTREEEEKVRKSKCCSGGRGL